MTLARSLLVGLVLGSTPGALAGAPESGVPDLTLEGTNDRSYALRATVSEARFTVFVFFSATCPCMVAHDERLRELARSYQEKGVQFFLVDPEVGDALERGKVEIQRRQYPFPILADPQARFARAMKAQFATTTVVFDSEGRVRYRGGIDNQNRHVGVSPGERRYLEEVLSALLSGKSPDASETKSFGCYLRTS